MPKLPDYLIYKKSTKSSKLEIRKISGGKAGISVENEHYEFPFHSSEETFINRDDAQKIIEALQKYFHI